MREYETEESDQRDDIKRLNLNLGLDRRQEDERRTVGQNWRKELVKVEG